MTYGSMLTEIYQSYKSMSSACGYSKDIPVFDSAFINDTKEEKE